MRCIEIGMVREDAFAVLRVPEDWARIRAGARLVERVREPGCRGEWNPIYRVQPIAGGSRHHLVTG